MHAGVIIAISATVSIVVLYIYDYINRAPPPPVILPTDVPVGTIVSYAGNDIPKGWIACDSKSYPPTTYPELYAAIGYTYGMDGTKYRVPDTRGVFMRGMDANATRDTNRPAGSVQLDMLAYDGGNVNEIDMVAFYAVNKPPANWLACDGATYAINVYTSLYNVIGNLYGGASGSTFAVPDIRGVFIRGFDPTGTTDVDRQKGGFGARQGHMFASHNHGGVMRWPGGQVEQNQSGGPEDRSNVNQGTDAAGGSETRPVNIALLPCIRFR